MQDLIYNKERKFYSFAEIEHPLKLCPNCLLTCYDKEPEEYYVVVFTSARCECPKCRHRGNF